MPNKLLLLYSAYKEKHFAEQLLRISNVMFLVFAYWNMVRAWVSGNAGVSESILLALVIALAIISGVVIGALLLIRFTERSHMLILPLAVLACAATMEPASLVRLGVIPAIALVSLILVRLIIAAANKVNRF